MGIGSGDEEAEKDSGAADMREEQGRGGEESSRERLVIVKGGRVTLQPLFSTISLVRARGEGVVALLAVSSLLQGAVRVCSKKVEMHLQYTVAG